jgi:hypothetical protein
MGNQAGSLLDASVRVVNGIFAESYRNHIGGHSISDEQNDVLCLSHLGQVANQPASMCLLAIVVGQRCGILWESYLVRMVGKGTDSCTSRLVQSYPAVCFGGNIDHGWSLCIFGEEIWKEVRLCCGHARGSVFG